MKFQRKTACKILKKTIIIFGIIILCLLVFDLIFPFRPHIKYSRLCYSKENTLMAAYLSDDDKWRFYTENNEINDKLIETIIYKEDQYFYYHFGINPIAVIRAITNNILKQKRTSGASTITMQVARLLHPKERNYGNKLIEMFRAIQLEMHYSKKDILQMYLTLIPYGGNIEGIKAASLLYFQKPPQLLSLSEITALSIIPNKPSSLSLNNDKDKINEAKNTWLQRFRENQVFPGQEIEDALRENIHPERKDFVFASPHLTHNLTENFKENPNIRTTIHYQAQLKTNELVKQYVARMKSKNISNASVMVVDNTSGEVVVYVGSADFNDFISQGQVDGNTAIRSPGSTLKPFLYTLGFQRGIISLKTILEDVPMNFDGYEPENFDKKNYGRITADKSLAQSLNIPAVKILEETRIEDFLKYTRMAGIQSLWKQKANLGLSLILGGCGVKMEEMVLAYSCLAREGVYLPLTYQTNEKQKKAKPIQVWDNKAVYLTNKILTEHQRPDLPHGYENNINIPKIAWKTGTSYGRRDAWSIGYNRRFTIGVWLGNFDGKGSPELTGNEIATPLLFEIFNTLDYRSNSLWYAPPKGVSTRKVCTYSGNMPQGFCTETTDENYIVGYSPSKPCTHLAAVFTNKEQTESYCSHCVAGKDAQLNYFDNISPELKSFYQKEHILFKKIPPHFPLCFSNKTSENKLQIISPLNHSELLMDKSEGSQLALRCMSPPDVDSVYWYIDDKLMGKVAANQVFFVKSIGGRHTITCTDDKGRTARSDYSIVFY